MHSSIPAPIKQTAHKDCFLVKTKQNKKKSVYEGLFIQALIIFILCFGKHESFSEN